MSGMKDVIKCYVSGKPIPNRPGEGILSFAVPEYGVLFRCGVEGRRADMELVAFLTFLRFAEHNFEIFKTKEIHIFTDFPILVYMMNGGAVMGGGAEAIKQQADKYARGLQYAVKWIDEKANRAIQSVNNIPEMPRNAKVKIKTFANMNMDIHKPVSQKYDDFSLEK